MDTFPAAILQIISGTSNGLMRLGPFSSSFLCSRSIACKLPMPEPMAVPTRYGSSFSMSMPESRSASFAAATAYWENNSIRFAALKSMKFLPSKPFTSAAMWHLNPSVSNLVIGANPVFPSFTESQNCATLSPVGVIAPIPVTTTLLPIISSLSGTAAACRPAARRLLDGHAAVYGKYLPCDIIRLTGCKEYCHIRNIFWRSDPL